MKIGFRTSIFYALRCDRGQRDNNSKDSISQKMKYLVISLLNYENKNQFLNRYRFVERNR